jgi:LysM repeat protein
MRVPRTGAQEVSHQEGMTLRLCYGGLLSRSMRLRNALCGLALISSLAACGGGSGGTSKGSGTTISPLDPPSFATIPVTIAPSTAPPAIGADAGGPIGGAPPTYTIIPNDVPSGIAKKLGCPTWQEIAVYNEVLPDDFMQNSNYPGDTLNVPPTCTGSGATVAPADVAPSATQAPATPEVTEAPAVADGGGYTVLANDTVYGIAKKFGTSPTALAEANGWSDGINHAIFPGDKIKLPKAG